MPEILIVADDLSGAADCAAGCTIAGLDTLVLLAPSSDAAAEAVAVDVNSRTMAPEHAGQAMANAIKHTRDARTKMIYQKIDSTLRGNWTMELAQARQVIAEVSGHPVQAIVAPAFPSLGRTMAGGHVMLHGKPLDAGNLPARLEQAGIDARRLDLTSLRQGPAHVAALLRELATSGAGAIVCDAETDQDLRRIAEAGIAAGVPVLWVGSGGLMRQLAHIASTSARAARPSPATTAPLLFVVGSASDVSHAQFDLLAVQPGITAITIAPVDLLAPLDSAAFLDLECQLDAAIQLGMDTAVAIGRGGPSDPATGARMATALAAILRPRLDRFGALVVTGGETARCLLDASGVHAIRLGGEVEPGVPWGVTVGQLAVPLVTKAGAFGDSHTLLRCREALKRLGA